MRFGKRNKAKLIPLRRDVSERNEIVQFPMPEDEGIMPVGTVPEPTSRAAADIEVTGDNTQRLLTALGRFHRYVAKGQSGAPQTFWSDDCMNQLIAALELAVGEGWNNVIEALTGTARILQSYENAQLANMAIPFLNDSYELLCLMVGDLIVKNERSGVMGRWRARYDKAIGELDACGVALVADEASEPVVDEIADYPVLMPADAAADEPEAVGSAPEDMAMPFVAAEVHCEEPIVFDEEPVVDELLPFLMPAEPAGRDNFDAEALTPLERIVESQVKRECALSATDISTVNIEPPEPGKEPEVVHALDVLCEQLSALSGCADEGHEEPLKALLETVHVLRQFSVEHAWAHSGHVCEQMGEVCNLLLREGHRPGERFFDIGYAFCETYVQSITDHEDKSVALWLMDVDDYCGSLRIGLLTPQAPIETAELSVADEAVASADEAAQPPQQEPVQSTTTKTGSAELLLENAQHAIAHGDVSNAKTLALQAVAELARREADKAAQRVREAETRFRENAESMECERDNVRQAELSVTEAESRVREALLQQDEQQAAMTAIADKAAAIERRIGEIDEQIRVLQLAREEEMVRAGEVQSDLARAREEELNQGTELERVREAESAARAYLENARQTVKTLQRRQLEIEETLARAHESLVHYQSSLSDIDRTIVQLRPQSGGTNAGATDMLF